MLAKPDVKVVYESGKAVGVTSENETAKAKFVVGDPSYFADKVRKTSQVVRAMCEGGFSQVSKELGLCAAANPAGPGGEGRGR